VTLIYNHKVKQWILVPDNFFDPVPPLKNKIFGISNSDWWPVAKQNFLPFS